MNGSPRHPGSDPQVTTQSQMARDIAQIPQAAMALDTAAMQAQFIAAANLLRRRDPVTLLTVARGSSDHAATYLKYAVELTLGIPVASVGPSIGSVFGGQLRTPTAAMLAISQSGGSRDLIETAAMLGRGGAARVVLTNTAGSGLTTQSDITLDIAAGPEHAVAATKSYVNSVLAGLWLVAHWAGDDDLKAALRALPPALDAALQADPAPLITLLTEAPKLTVTARGPALGLAHEAALKAQEVMARDAQAYSAAELLHGPATLMGAGHPVLVFGDAAETGMGQALAQLADQGARLLRIVPMLPKAPSHRLTACLPQIVLFYRAVEAAARATGQDPDNPRFLKKKTVTV